MTDPWHDSAKDILTAASIPQDHKAELYDIYHDSPTADALKQNLSLVPPELADVARQLIEAKRISTTPEAMVPVVAALEHINQMDPRVLNLAEKNPQVLNGLLAGIEGK